MKYHVIVYGCQMNISDSERVSAVLESIKYKATPNMDEADLIVVTMCSVRQSAVDRIHGLIEKFKKLKKGNPKLKTILTGCILKKDRKKFIAGFDLVIDIKDIKRLPEFLDVKNPLNNKDDYLDITPKHSSPFSANIPIMTGCNNFCAYCVVPYAREREISRPAKDIIKEINDLIKRGYKEVWLLGQNVNSYKDGEINFSKLLKLINDIPGNFWMRFTSSHPKDFNDELIEALAIGGKITPYLNLPIQSGDDDVLKSMNRHYTVKDYKTKISKLREKIPGICLSTDIIVGFPGETKKQFLNTAKLFKDVKYDMAYINKYSTRAGTAAARLKDNVSFAEKKNREKALTKILKETALENNKKFMDVECVALITEKDGDNYFGRNEHYKPVQVKSKNNLVGKFVKIKIIEVTPWSLLGTIK